MQSIALYRAEAKMAGTLQGVQIFVYGKKEGYTNVSAQTIHSWVILSDDLKGIAKFVTVDSKRKELKRRLAPNNPLFRNIKNMPGKSYLS